MLGLRRHYMFPASISAAKPIVEVPTHRVGTSKIGFAAVLGAGRHKHFLSLSIERFCLGHSLPDRISGKPWATIDIL